MQLSMLMEDDRRRSFKETQSKIDQVNDDADIDS